MSASVHSAREGKIIVGMSGGVDSSVAALLLLQAGHAVEGLFMKNWEEDDGTDYCTAAADLADAQAVCQRLGIPLHEATFAAEYWDNVFADFLAEYQAGRTPNPDVLCNREIKFKVFMDYAEALGATRIATGHYARLAQVGGEMPNQPGSPIPCDPLHPVQANGELRLLKGLDADKDQSYFLQAVPQERLATALFPLGELTKPEVRALAKAHGLPTHKKADSTGICFIGERRFKDFLARYLPAQPGDIVSLDGQHLGRHQGLMYHTLGQRQGLGIGGLAGRGEAPWYVAGKRLASNELVVVQGKDHPALFTDSLRTGPVAWFGSAPKQRRFRCAAKLRYRQPDQACEVVQEGEGLLLTFDQPQRSVTPGQWACLYDGDVVLGGAVIESTGAEGECCVEGPPTAIGFANGELPLGGGSGEKGAICGFFSASAASADISAATQRHESTGAEGEHCVEGPPTAIGFANGELPAFRQAAGAGGSGEKGASGYATGGSFAASAGGAGGSAAAQRQTQRGKSATALGGEGATAGQRRSGINAAAQSAAPLHNSPRRGGVGEPRALAPAGSPVGGQRRRHPA